MTSKLTIEQKEVLDREIFQGLHSIGVQSLPKIKSVAEELSIAEDQIKVIIANVLLIL